MSREQKANFELPPTTALRVYSWSDLPCLTATALYRITDPGREPREFYAAHNKRRVLEGLMRSPIYAASYCRLSDKVLPLRRDDGVNIECRLYRNDAETGRQVFGIYFLVSKVELIEVRGVAA